MVTAVQRVFSEARQVAEGLFSCGLFSSEQRRRKSRAVGASAEPCEMRCMPAPLGAVPQLAYTQVNSNSITGMVVDDGNMNVFTVDMDLHNDGTIDQSLPATWSDGLQGSVWQWLIPRGSIGIEDVEVGLTPRETNLVGTQTGTKLVVVIPGIPNTPPEFVSLEITQTNVSGMIDDDTLTQGSYVIEAAFGTTENGFQSLGQVNSFGMFMLTHNFPNNNGTIPVYIRIRETHSFDQLTSETLVRYYTSSTPNGGGSSGTGGGLGGGGLGGGGLGGMSGGGSLFGGNQNDDDGGLFGLLS